MWTISPRFGSIRRGRRIGAMPARAREFRGSSQRIARILRRSGNLVGVIRWLAAATCGERHGSVFFEREQEAVDHSGRDRRANALAGIGGRAAGCFPRLGRAVFVIIDRRFLRRNADAADDDHRLPVHLDQEGNFAAQPQMALLGYGGGEHAGHARVDGVAALLQHADIPPRLPGCWRRRPFGASRGPPETWCEGSARTRTGRQ